MIELVLRTESFYFSYTYDITHTFQRLQTSSPDFHTIPFIERADQRFVWNRYLLSQLTNNRATARFALPLIHGCRFIDIIQSVPYYFSSLIVVALHTLNINGHSFMYGVVSRRSTYRAGTR
jgi:hypothetical protein